MSSLWVVLILTWTAVALCCFPSRAQAAPPSTPRPASPTFRADFERSFQSRNASLRKQLASSHPDQLRPLLDQLLADLISASGQKNSKMRKNISALSIAVAEEASRLGDRFPRRQVRRRLSWTSQQMSRKSQADAELRKAEAANAEGRYGDVAGPGLAALNLYNELRDEAGAGDALHLLGQSERKLALYAAALRHCESALSLARKSGDSLREGRSLVDLADVYERQKEWQQAIVLYRQALQVFKMPAHWQEAGRALRQLGDVYAGSRDFVRAYEVFSQALAYAEGAGNARLMAEAHDYLGYCHRQLGDSEKALRHHLKALELSARLPDSLDRSKAGARALNHLGVSCLEIAERAVAEMDETKGKEFYEQALEHTEKALEMAVAAQDRWRQGYILRALSTIHRQIGLISEPGEAKQQYLKSLSRADQSLALALSMKEQEWQGLALHQRGLALAYLGLESEGLATFQRALDLWERIGDLLSAGFAHRFIGRQFHEGNKRLPEAAADYESARAAFHKIGDLELEACAITDLARVNGALGRKAEAVRLYSEAMAKLERVRSKAGLPEFRRAFMGKAYERYEEATLFMLENGLDDHAFKLAESMKARLFLDQLAEARFDLAKGIDPEMKKRRDEIENDLNLATRSIQDAYRNSVPDEAEIERIQQRQEQLEADLDRVRKHIRLKNPLYSSVQYPEPITVNELQARVLRDDEALVEYFVSRKGVFCFVVTQQKYQIAKLPVEETELRTQVNVFLENLTQGFRRGEGFDRAGSAELYEILLRPFEWAFEGRTLFIVPDGILAKVPFEALVVARANGFRYFHEDQRMKYLQSASVLAVLRSFASEFDRSGSFVGFGDPVFDYESFKSGKPEAGAGPEKTEAGRASVTGAVPKGGKPKLIRLEGSGEEVRAIEEIFTQKSMEHKSLLRSDATEDKAKAREMEKFRYIHFSTHGLLAPGFQAVALSQIPDTGEDGFLTIGEIMNLKYSARLVVLSACNTGLGWVERGEGVTGLTRAVMYAGTPAAVVSLWGVDDEGTKELMVRFYDNMVRKGLPKAESLRLAKQDMLNTRYRHPFFWSAFVMYGE